MGSLEKSKAYLENADNLLSIFKIGFALFLWIPSFGGYPYWWYERGSVDTLRLKDMSRKFDVSKKIIK